jgi:hypothetical protein
MNGHTPGVSVRGSDEANADQREGRRRMRRERYIGSEGCLNTGFRTGRNGQG